MGASSSISSSLTPDACIRLLMPVYYLDDEVTVEDIAEAVKPWNCIVKNESEKYVRAFDAGKTKAPSCLSWFYETFYKRLFDVRYGV